MSRYMIRPSRRFREDFEEAVRKGCPVEALRDALSELALGNPPVKKLDRPLGGRAEGCRECVVAPGFQLVYRYRGENLILYLLRSPNKMGGFSMFLLTEIKYRLLRARGRTALLLAVAMLLVGSMSFYLGNIQSNRDALSQLSSNVPVIVRVVNRSGSNRSELFIDTQHYDALTASAVHDVRALANLTGAYSEYARNIPKEEFVGGDTSIKGANCLAALNVSPEDVEFLDGYGPECMEGNEAVCILTSSFADVTGLNLGDDLSAALYTILNGTMYDGYYPIGEPPMKVVGICSPSGMAAYADVYAPAQFLRETAEAAGEVFSYESLSATLDDPMALNEYKAGVMAMGFLETFDTAGDIYTGDGLSIEDEMFIKTAGELRQNLEVFGNFLIPFFALIIGMITLVTFLVLRGSRKEIAIASSLGRQKSLNAASHFFGAIAAELLGCILALPVMCVLIELIPMTAFMIIGVYMACACVGTALALTFILRFDPLELLTKVD